MVFDIIDAFLDAYRLSNKEKKQWYIDQYYCWETMGEVSPYIGVRIPTALQIMLANAFERSGIRES